MSLCMLCLLVTTQAEPRAREWDVDGQQRTGLVCRPSRPERGEGKMPVVLVFHGHGGSAAKAVRQMRMHEAWPAALVIYPEGLPTSTPGDPDGKKNGWVARTGGPDNRDLRFVDKILETVKMNPRVDQDRIYAMGHSNGGFFTYLLWQERPDEFAAFGPSAGLPSPRAELKPKPVVHVAGEKDPLVKFDKQLLAMDLVRKVNGCTSEGREVGPGVTHYGSPQGPPVLTFIHPGGHEYNDRESRVIARFFQNQKRQDWSAVSE